MSELLKMTRYGEGNGTPLLIAHGLFGSARNWGVLSKRFAVDRPVVAVDMRNHGDSFWSDEHSYPSMADDLAHVIGEIGGQADVLGHSMGGKAAMVLALTQPDLVRKLIVADIAPVTYPAAPSEEVAAMKAIDLSVVERRSDADLQLQRYVTDPSVRAFLLQSISMGDQPRWKLNLDVLDDTYGDIRAFPEVRGQFGGETLFITGALSSYVQPKDETLIRHFFPNIKIVPIPDAGHWVHAENPRAFEEQVKQFLAG